MKRILLMGVLLLSIMLWNEPLEAAMGNNQVAGSRGTLAELEAKGFRIIADQSFTVNLENWGEVRFVPGRMGAGLRDFSLFLIGKNDEVLYQFPPFTDWSILYEVQAVAFVDVDEDGLKDVVIIGLYATGVSPTGNVPFPVAGIYFQRGKDFVVDRELNRSMNAAGQNKSIDMILAFARNYKQKNR